MIQFLYKVRYIIGVGNLIIAINIHRNARIFSEYFISHIDTGPSMLSNGSNSVILSCCLLFLYLFLVFSHKAAAKVKETLVLRNILYRDTTAFLA